MGARERETEILYEAAGSSRGIVVKVSDFSLALSRLQKAKSEAADPFLDCLSFRRSPLMPEEEIWIHKKGAEHGPPPQANNQHLLETKGADDEEGS